MIIGHLNVFVFEACHKKCNVTQLNQLNVNIDFSIWFLNSDSHLQKNVFLIYFTEFPSKMMKKCFSFHLKSSFHSQNIYIFALTFWECRKKT